MQWRRLCTPGPEPSPKPCEPFFFGFARSLRVYPTVISTQTLDGVQDNVLRSPGNDRQRITDQTFSLGFHSASTT